MPKRLWQGRGRRLAGMRQGDVPKHSEEPVIDALEEAGHVAGVCTAQQCQAVTAVDCAGKGGDTG